MSTLIVTAFILFVVGLIGLVVATSLPFGLNLAIIALTSIIIAAGVSSVESK